MLYSYSEPLKLIFCECEPKFSINFVVVILVAVGSDKGFWLSSAHQLPIDIGRNM